MRNSKMSYVARAAFFLALVGCSSSASSERTALSSEGQALGNADGSDGADRACNVILRDVHTNENRGGLETSCDASGTCWVVWSGDVDISNLAVADGGAPFVRYQSGSDPTWYE